MGSCIELGGWSGRTRLVRPLVLVLLFEFVGVVVVRGDATDVAVYEEDEKEPFDVVVGGDGGGGGGCSRKGDGSCFC
jgi:hypothetical protein